MTAKRRGAALDGLRQYLGVFRYSGRAISLVWSTNRPLTVGLALLSLINGLLPAAVAYVGKLIIDAVVQAATTGAVADRDQALVYVAAELVLVVLLAAGQRGIGIFQSLLRAQLGHRVNYMILEKALSLELTHFEDSEFYDKMTRARREASSRPLSLVMRTFGLIQNGISLVTYGALLLSFSGWAVGVLLVAALPAFFAETRYSGEAFRLFRWRTPETRQQMYLEAVLAREDYAKEVKLYNLGPHLLSRYDDIYQRLYAEDRSLTWRRGVWGYVLGLLSTAAFYGAYGWIALATMSGDITLGDMTMYVMVFKQGQSALSSILSAIGGLYEDNLYLSNLFEFVEEAVPQAAGTRSEGPEPGDGVRFENVSFVYPGADKPAVENISLHIQPGSKLALVGENGSGKTTLIKLLTRMYSPSTGRILLDGLDLAEWDPDALRARIGVIFQDFARYQFIVGENIGVGEVDAVNDRERWEEAATKGLARPIIDELPEGYDTQLGRWFKGGRELSGGQWQKIALARAFMRKRADILVLDEPTAAMDAEAEVLIFEHFREITKDQIAVIISHRFSTVRMADHIIVLNGGRVVESGSHEALMERDGPYARLFSLQAAGYR
ncbi:ABC transporter ATP-binding protein [Haliangium ochraceum]|uniref:ABC transporter related protein n=1 Tax=Haliangium ochraceum (strain DSM 14365 / JCM 11303 / SMP-2) TaxID=502025 RepID=D0LJ16_HALO1|nr:ABC transporter ATP-binding protein [Haliangium ochraceum]ACY13045.1 ABC transporter related protein [Haliangium ochraceum DSM 14365]